MFDPIKLRWNDQSYVVAPDRVMGAIASVEDVVTMEELGRYLKKRTMPFGKLAMAYGSLLRYAGARVTDEEVYLGMFGGGDTTQAMLTAMTTLLAMLLPPGALATADGKANPTQRPKGEASSSKSSTKRRSVTAG
jgi:hypothetical protein